MCGPYNRRKEMTRARTTEILFDDDSGYFTAMLNNGGVRIGLKNCLMHDIPAGHAWFDRVFEASALVEVEALHDELVSLNG